MNGEVWKAVVGFEGIYEVSSHGRIRSRHSGSIRIMKPSRASKYGHLQIGLRKAGKRKWFGVHRLVMHAFVGPCPIGKEVRHRNGMPAVNELSNLLYGTRLENASDRRAHGRAGAGTANGRSKLSDGCVDRIRDMRSAGIVQVAIAKYFGVGQAQISRIDRRVQW